MPATNTFDGFTLVCFGIGMVIGVTGAITYGSFLTPFLQLYLGIFGLERANESVQSFPTMLAMVFLGLAGAGIQHFSAKIEEGAAEVVQSVVWSTGGLLAFTLVPSLLIAVLAGIAEGFNPNPGSTGLSSIPSLLLVMVAGLLGLVMMIPALICWFVVFPLAAGLAVGGLLCLPRLLYYHSIRHPLRQAWESGKQNGVISPQDVSRGIGNPAQNVTEARKLKSDLERLEREIAQQQAELERDRDAMRSAILGDAERFETEKRISAMLRNIDAMQTEVAGYREYMRKTGKK